MSPFVTYIVIIISHLSSEIACQSYSCNKNEVIKELWDHKRDCLILVSAHDMYHSSRLNPQYSSFLLQSSAAMRQAHGRAAAALGKAPHDSWAAAAAVASVGSAAAGQALENYAGSTHSHYGGMTGKSLYKWI